MRLHDLFVQTSEMLCLLSCLVACATPLPASQQNVTNPTSPQVPSSPRPFPTAQPHVADPTTSSTAASPSPLVYREPFNVKVDVGGYKLSIKCVGTGNPTVVFDAGLNDTGDKWIKVWTKVKDVTRACIYDRAGRGESDRGPVPRTSQVIVTELHTLLVNASIDGPYVLVGHSFGGYNVRLYASQYRDQVAGMVLVDTTHEDEIDRINALLPPTPGECQALAASRRQVVNNREGVDFPTSSAQVRQARHTLGDLPLIVLSRGRASETPAGCDIPASVNQQIDHLHRDLQNQLAGLSSNSRHIIAEKSGHYIQLDQPELVIDAIVQVVQAAQTNTRLAPP